MHEPWRDSAREIARRIRTRECTAADVVDAHLARIATVNPALNALVRVLGDEARAAARAADEAVRQGAPLGPLHGVPFTVKENIDVAGLPTTWGVAGLAQAVVAKDAPVVERMRAAGAILLGRGNLPDMGLRIVTESSLHGITRNPWDASRTAGGSSGGEAAAIAAGMTPLGLGNDLGGSLRLPAAACGIASIRPSAARVPYAGTVPAPEQMLFAQLMLAQGPMARTVADVRLALEVIMGAHPRDPWSISAPLQGAALPRPLRVALLPSPPGGDCEPAVAARVRRAADALADAGYEILEAEPPAFEEAVQLWATLLSAEMGSIWPRLGQLVGPDCDRIAREFFERWPAPATVAALVQLHAKRDGVGRAWSRFFERHPLLLTPAWTALPPEHGFDLRAPSTLTGIARTMMPANLLGLPSACVSAGLDEASGLPVGVILTGPRFREDLCLEAAEAIEARVGVVTPLDPRG